MNHPSRTTSSRSATFDVRHRMFDRRPLAPKIARTSLCPTNSYPVHPAFTLVELLVVLGVIGLLVAILLPAVGRIRDQGRSVQCLSNLRQLGIAAIGYASSDHDRRFPIAYYTAVTSTTITSFNWDFTLTRPRVSGSSWTVVPGLIWRGAGSGSGSGTGLAVQQCPAYEGAVGTSSDPYTGYNYNTSYVGHGDAETNPIPARPADMPHLDRCAMFGDGGWSGGTNKFMRAPFPNPADAGFSGRYAGTQAYRHNDATNVVFGDGHAESLKERYTTTSPADTAKVAAGTGFISIDNGLYSGE